MATRSVLKWGIVCALIAGALYYWYRARPYMAASEVLNRYETAHYAHDFRTVEKLMYRLPYDKTSQEDALSKFDLFEKFEPGFELLSAERVEWDWFEEMIAVELTKVEKNGRGKRHFSDIRLINDGRGWKVFQYYFPDMTEY